MLEVGCVFLVGEIKDDLLELRWEIWVRCIYFGNISMLTVFKFIGIDDIFLRENVERKNILELVLGFYYLGISGRKIL